MNRPRRGSPPLDYALVLFRGKQVNPQDKPINPVPWAGKQTELWKLWAQTLEPSKFWSIVLPAFRTVLDFEPDFLNGGPIARPVSIYNTERRGHMSMPPVGVELAITKWQL